MRIAITGATGFLGGHLVRVLADAGHEITAVVRNPDKASALGVAVHRADLSEPDALAAGFAGQDVVVHNAALASFNGDLSRYEAVNVQGTANVLDAIEQASVRRLVAISTVAVYRTQLWRPMAEDATPYGTERRFFNPSDLTTDWRYALTKSRAERLLWERDLALTVLRPGPVYGSGDDKVTGRFLSALDDRVRLAPTVGLPMVHASDVALACLSSLDRPQSHGKAYNMAAPPVSPLQIMRELIRQTGRGPRLIPVPVPVKVRYDTSAAARDLDWRPRSLADGITEVLDKHSV